MRKQPQKIESRQNSRVKQLRAVFAGNPRLSDGQVGIEGVHLLQELLRSGLQPEAVFVSEDGVALLEQFDFAAQVAVFEVPDDILRSALATEAPQGIAALLAPPVFDRDSLLGSDTASVPLVLVAAGLQDPGNLGTLIRSAEAFAATGVLCLPGTVSVWNQKAMRASAGSVFRVPVVQASGMVDLQWLRQSALRVFAGVARDATRPDHADLRGPVALLIGNEGAGLSEEVLAFADERITIACPGDVESLNAAVAGSLLLYEAAKQRGRRL